MVFDPTSRHGTFPVAIVGLSCRFPGANNPDEYWALLKSGGDAVGTVPPDRWDVDYYYNPDPARTGKIYTRAGGFLPNVKGFDAGFFGISPREAAQIDPQQKLALELAWEALEDAGIVPANIAGTDTSVVIGVSSNDFAGLQREEGAGADPYTMSGSALSLVANRISYIFDIHGPSLSLDTACSSALVAVHEACESLRRGDAPLAIAGGINLLLSPWGGIGFSRARMLSPSGHCHAFDERADGYVRSEGGGVVILKALDAAIADGDRIRAVILGSGVNSDGKTNGISMPNAAAQELLLRRVYARARVDPAKIHYVEAHGTGTNVGDPVECTALGAVMGAARPSGQPCLIGSGKTNIGHLESAAGAAGLVKVVLALQHREIPATIGVDMPNSKLRLDEMNLSVVTKHTPIARRAGKLVMGVNSFGFGGTNAHAVVAEYRTPTRPSESAAIPLLFVSARSPASLKELAARHERLLREKNANAAAICSAAARARGHFEHRLAVSGRSASKLADGLKAFLAGDGAPNLVVSDVVGTPARLAFVFSGNGSQWLGMGRDLITHEPLIATWIDKVDAVLQPLTGWSLRDYLVRDDAPQDAYDRTEIAQPTLFALQVAILEWLRAKGIDAEACLGHSVGEVAAAYGAGALTLEQACRVIAHRSAVQGKTAGMGKMMAAGLTAERAAEVIAPFGNAVTIAAFNSPGSVTLAGSEAVLQQIGNQLEKDGTFYRLLALDYAFHSRVMDGVKGELLERLSGLTPSAGTMRFISTVTGGEVAGTDLGPDYWWDNIREPVRFAEAVAGLAGTGFRAFLEIGPHAVLTFYIRDCLRDAGVAGAALSTLRRQEPEAESLLMAAASCYVAGAAVDLATLFPGKGPWAALPAYPWHREDYELPRRQRPWSPIYGARQHPLLGYRMATAIPTWENVAEPALLGYLRDHVIQGSMVFPASGYVELALAASALHHGGEAQIIDGFRIEKPLVIAENDPPRLELSLSGDDGSFQISASAGDQKPSQVVVGRVAPLSQKYLPDHRLDLDALRSQLGSHMDGAEHYRRCGILGLDYGVAFRGVSEIWFEGAEALAHIVAPNDVAAEAIKYQLHPALLDASIQSVFATFQHDNEDMEDAAAFVPVAINRMRVYRRGDRIGWCHARLTERRKRAATVDLTLGDETGVIAEIEGLLLRRLDSERQSAVPAYHWRQQLQSRAPHGPVSPALQTAALAAAALPTLSASHVGEQLATTLERLAVAYAARAVEQVAEGAEHVLLDELVTKGAVARRNLPYLRSLIAMLERRDVLVRDGAGWRCHDPVEAPEPLWRDAIGAHPSQLASLELVARCGERISEFLASTDDDAQSPLLRDADLVEQLMESDALFQRRNEVAVALVRKLVAMTPSSDPIRILEIGDGPAGLAAAVVPELPAERSYYEYAVADEAAAARAIGDFAGQATFRPRVRRFDRDEETPTAAGDSFDLVLIGNMMHGATELRAAMARVSRLVRPGGVVAVIGAGASELLTFVFGMSSRWWDVTDIDLRTDGPLVPSDVWARLLKDVGLTDIEELAGGKPYWPHYVLVARKKGGAHFSEINEQEPATWLLGAQQDVPAEAVSVLADRLDIQGHRVIALDLATEFHRLGADRFAAPLGDRASYRTVLRDMAGDAGEAKLNVAWFAGSVAATADGLDTSYGVVALLQSAEELGLLSRVNLWLVTAGAMTAPGRASAVNPAQALIWGIGRTAMTERPDLTCRLIDLDPVYDAEVVAATLLDEFQRIDAENEDEVILSGSGRYVNRVRRGLPEQLLAQPSYGLSNVRRDGHDEMVLHARQPQSLDPGQVRVRVHASGLNFRDVLQRGGILPEEAFEGGFAGATLGMEFSGQIVEAGPDVSNFSVGDAVFGFAPAALSSEVVANETSVFAKPARWSHAEAATMPVAMVTALYSLDHLSRLRRGERVLIHGAAGGVGLAAIQIAQAFGAEVYATAGTPEKRAFLRRLGVPFIFDSRTLDFDYEIRRITNGEGVDVVLNSIAGEAIARGVALLRPYGRFVELGKRDFFANSKLGLEPFRRNIQFFGVDVNTLIAEKPELTAAVVARLMALIGDGTLRPLANRAFPVTRATEAFRYMQQSRQIGKVVLTFADDGPRVEPLSRSHLALRSDATYLVTGGRGGFGLATAEWLASRGVRHLALIGRRAETSADAAAVIRVLRAKGITVKELACDVSDLEALRHAFATIDRELPPLRGVFHAAGVIEDALLPKLTRERFDAVTRPKVVGAFNLHELTRHRSLDHFVLYSSATTLIGNPGQASYVAANVYLESLAQLRRTQGLPALAMLWGAIGEVGHLGRNAELAKTMEERLGVAPIAPARAFTGLEQAMLAGVVHAALAELDWGKLSRLPRIAQSPKYSVLGARTNGADSLEASLNLTQLMAHVASATLDEAMELVAPVIVKQVSEVMRIPAGKLDLNRSLIDVGMDSMMMVELQMMMERAFGLRLPVLDLMDRATVVGISRRLAEEIQRKAKSNGVDHSTSIDVDIDAVPEERLDEILGELLKEELDIGADRRVV